MRRVLGIMVTGACMSAAQAGVDTVEVDRPFVVAVGHQVQWTAADLRLRFEEVLADSRCPRDERCVVAGVARIRVRVDGAGQVGQRLDLQLPDPSSAPLPGSAASLTLLRLDPYPANGRTAMSSAALATMVIRRAVAGANDR